MDALALKRDISGWGYVRKDKLKTLLGSDSICAFRFGHSPDAEEETNDFWCTPAALWSDLRRKLESPKSIDWEKASKHFSAIHHAVWDDFCISFESVVRTSELEVIFNGLVKHWQEATGGHSVTTRRYAHPSYHGILVLGEDAVPLILRELQERPDWWFEALKVLTKANPVKEGASFEEAVDAWIEWGKQNHKI